MGIPFRALLTLALAWLAFVFLREAHALQAKPDADGTRVILMFMGVVFTGLVAAGLVVTAVLPQFGEGIGNFFFNPNEKSEEHPHAVAITAIARGDYQRAVQEYQRITTKNPEDTLAYSEAARLLCEKLHQCEPAASMIEEALDREWPPEDAAFLSMRLAEIYWHHQHDHMRAREIFLQVMEAMPDTKQANTAAHKLHELDRKIMAAG